MSRKDDLDREIRESYGIILQYEDVIRGSDRPEEKVRATRVVQEQWKSIKRYLEEYRQIADTLSPDLAEIAAHFASPSTVLVIGSGNSETILDLSGALVIGTKHDVVREELVGGSGVNYTLRMANYDPTMQILPILSIGQDRVGEHIRQEILKAMSREHISRSILDFISSEDFFCRKLKTAQSTVVTTAQTRTIFREEPGNAATFRLFVQRRLDDVQVLTDVLIGAILIGHIYADGADQNPNQEGQITKGIIDAYQGKAILFANFGDSQYQLGHEFWKDYLPKLTVFQLSIEEARRFFKDSNGNKASDTGRYRPVWSLSTMMEWFQERKITAIITLDRFGAVATFRDHKGVWFAPAFDLNEFQDATGAGDAFGAGLVYTLCQAKREIDCDLFLTAIKEARMWSAYACTTRGATSRCPNKAELDRFKQVLRERGQDPDFIECRELHAWDSIFRILDKVY